jgi:TolA-binding protein
VKNKASLIAILLLITLSFSGLAALPSSPPPSPGGFEETPSEQITASDNNDSNNDLIQAAPNSSVLTLLEARITALESKVEKLEQEKGQLEKSGFFSTPFIILLSINLTLLGFIIYFFFIHRPAQE